LYFSKYFHKWLYGKNGYYISYKEIGKEGDFFTAVSTSVFFGGSIAKRLIFTIENGWLPSDTTVVEIGAHKGYLLADIIQFIYTIKPELLKTLKFAIVERFVSLQKIQKKYFYDSFGDKIDLIHFNNIESLKLSSAFIVANELFDAFDCELVLTNKKNKLQVAVVKDHKIYFQDCKNKKILRHCQKYNITKGEISVGFEEFAENLSSNIEQFEFVTFDYGELYPRNDFSCRIYQKHNVYPIFDKNINLQDLFAKSDITYDVNFQHLIDSFNSVEINLIKYDTQLKMLIKFGITNLLKQLYENANENIYLKEINKVKTLLEPTGMGDRFKAVIFRKEK
jgi:SAM-dependent MidA family methyltransferase